MECGPGAAETIAGIFPNLKFAEGMGRKRSDQLAAGPFFMELTQILLEDDAGRPIIEVCKKFGFPLPGTDTHQFFSCEKRQWRQNLKRGPLDHEPGCTRHGYWARGVGVEAHSEYFFLKRLSTLRGWNKRRKKKSKCKKQKQTKGGSGAAANEK